LATASGGGGNIASGDYATVCGGQNNEASGYFGTVVGGLDNTASGRHTYAFGYNASTSSVDSTAVFNWGANKGTVFIGQDAIASAYRLYVNGSAYATGVWNTSDMAFKTNVRPLGSSLDLVNALNPVRYSWKAGMEEYGIEGSRDDIGFIAQDLQGTMPEVVREMDDEGHLAVNYDPIVAVNTAAIQELAEMVDKLKSENETLKERIEVLESTSQ
jgi:hypothetical protein